MWPPQLKYLLRTFTENTCRLFMYKTEKGGKGSGDRKTRIIAQAPGEGQ